jgi:hypothetical protein
MAWTLRSKPAKHLCARNNYFNHFQLRKKEEAQKQMSDCAHGILLETKGLFAINYNQIQGRPT